jgi:hypothetical protein
MRAFACVVLLAGCSFRVPGVDVQLAPAQEAGPGSFDGAVALVDASTQSIVPIDMAGPLLPPDMSKMPPPAPGNVGDACLGTCGGGLTCMPWGLAGYCTKPCGMCPVGSRCADIGGGMHYCLLDTSADDTCQRNDLMCRNCGGHVCALATFCDEC